MTVEAIERKAGPYDFTAGGQYPFYFKVFDKTDIFVVVTNTDGVETTINADTDYSVTINDVQDENAGGSVTLIKDYANHKITIGSQVPYDQSVIITNKGGFYPDTLNKAYDKLTILCQQNKEELKRAIKVDISSNTSADDYKEELEELVDQSVTSAASAAASAQQAVTASSKAVSDAATALEQSKTALTQSGTALIQSSTALENSVSAVNSIQPALEAAQKASSDAAEAVTKSEQALSETAAIDDKVDAAVDAALSGAVIPGLTPETIAGALGYTPYDAETNSKDFATSAEVSDEIQQAIAAIPDFAGATAENAGKQGFVPAPATGDQNKVLKGDGTWGTIASRNIGETVFSLLPLSDAGLHLLDGSLLPVGGIYDAFIAHIAGLQTDYPELFVGESAWQESVSTYGVCGKFVYTEGVSLRIPKITGFVEGTLDATALGNLVEAGLPNIKGVSNIGGNASKIALASGALKQVRYQQNHVLNGSASDTNDLAEVELDASLYNPIYGRSSTVQPQAIKGYLYIVVATSVKTDIEVDIDQIATDFNGKAGVDLANVNQTGKALIANMAMPSGQYVDLSFPQNGTTEYTAPSGGYFCLSCDASNGFIQLLNPASGLITGYSVPEGATCRLYIPAKKGEKIQATVSATVISQYAFRFIYAEGSQPA